LYLNTPAGNQSQGYLKPDTHPHYHTSKISMVKLRFFP
jgi:hypothetical protein